jgi:abortive infection bacteriophage resistance protein
MPKLAGYFFTGGAMSTGKLSKTYLEQLQILKNRGLGVTDEAGALHILEHHNYYRLSAYRFPLTEHDNPDRFLPGSTFDDLWALYCFDRGLRQLVSEACKRIEISVRARWAYVLGHAHGPHSYENPAFFKNRIKHAEHLKSLDAELDRSDEVFVSHFRIKHGMRRPPIWAACEVMSFGLLSRFYSNIKFDRDKKRIAATYVLAIDSLKSLLEHTVYLRNLCAHHSRLWNRRFTITVGLPVSRPSGLISSFHAPQNRRIYNSLVLLIHMLKIIEPETHWPNRLIVHLHSLNRKCIHHMGFPSDWQSRPVWNEVLKSGNIDAD